MKKKLLLLPMLLLVIILSISCQKKELERSDIYGIWETSSYSTKDKKIKIIEDPFEMRAMIFSEDYYFLRKAGSTFTEQGEYSFNRVSNTKISFSFGSIGSCIWFGGYFQNEESPFSSHIVLYLNYNKITYCFNKVNSSVISPDTTIQPIPPYMW